MGERRTFDRLRRGWPWWGWLGGLLVAVAWPLNWNLPGPRTLVLFFPLWLGYILLVDSLVFRRTRTSLLHRSLGGFVSLFVASIPAWWTFELLNHRLQNWIYVGADHLGATERIAISSLNFSTVIPAVFETAELLRTCRWTDRLGAGPRLPTAPSALVAFAGAGGAMLAAMLLWPRLLYPLAWLSLLLLLDPLCFAGKRPSLLASLGRGDWRPAGALALGALTCGFFWELWNVRSSPKWIYDTPGADFWHVFEMPLLGYLGYLPFGMELYPLASLFLLRLPAVRL